ncbi:response regulator [bacterium]|nr:response regulator [bacterium]
MNSEASDANILLVEDDETDREAVVRAFRRHNLPYNIHLAKDGEEALALLQRGAEAKIERPYLILLDLNMPRMNGLEFLKALRKDSSIANSIVIVFTTSDNISDMRAAYQECVAGYLVKSIDDRDCSGLVELIRPYFEHVEFPPEQT